MMAESPLEGQLKPLPENRKALRQLYPGWAVLVQKLTEPSLRAKDVRHILGLTYRQIYHWHTRKLLWSRQESSGEWRHFSVADIIGLALVKKVAELGIPFDRLQNSFAVRMGAPTYLWRGLPYLVAGREAYLCTDFESFLDWYMPDGGSSKNSLSVPLDLEKPRLIVLLPVKPILTELARKLDLPDFKVSINPDGHYSFEIRGVPLRFEDLTYTGEGKTPVNTVRKLK
jgi:hypothetical protein